MDTTFQLQNNKIQQIGRFGENFVLKYSIIPTLLSPAKDISFAKAIWKIFPI